MKTVIITGANGNLGSVVTNTFLSKGYKVIATVVNEDARTAMPANKNLYVHTVDLTNEVESTAFVNDIIARHTQIDAAILLVGGFAMGTVLSTSSADIRKQIALNFETAYNIARPVFEHMMFNNSGRIIFIGARPSLEAVSGKNLVAYGLSKSLLFKLSEYLSEEAKGTNVSTTVVVPSTLDTPLNRKNMPDTDPRIWVKPEALAALLEFAISDTSLPLRESILKVYNNC
jgi:NAD(P)-dependent dehydrogenase (short-subunit alcohol dehydrogenase family)